MLNSSRIGDIGVGVCCCHPPIPCIGMAGVIVTGCPSMTICNMPDARIGDIVLGYCGHPGILVTGSPNTNSCNSPRVRISDVFAGCFTGVIVTGCPTHNTN